MSALQIAPDALNAPRQLDVDGVRVDVSREALNVALTYVEAMQASEPVLHNITRWLLLVGIQ